MLTLTLGGLFDVLNILTTIPEAVFQGMLVQQELLSVRIPYV